MCVERRKKKEQIEFEKEWMRGELAVKGREIDG
jgi:hypothetical protein